MSKVYNYIIFMTGISILLGFAGVDTGAALILNAVGLLDNPAGFVNTGFYQTLYVILTLVGVGGIVVGAIVGQKAESFVIAGFVAILLSFIADLVSIYTYMHGTYADWTANVAALILIPIIVGYLVAIVSYWRGAE